ncbi:MAG TPA: ABC transporter ATP-binding protein [bacterium]|nr:ABC transporter ATP-binding protein [bacterium]
MARKLARYACWLWRYYRHHKRPLTVLLTVSFLSSALAVVQPILLKNIFDLLQSGTTKPTRLVAVSSWIDAATHGSITNYVILLILFGLAAYVVKTTLIAHRAYMNIRLEWEFRQDSFNRITDKGPDFFNRFKTGDIVTRLTDDASEEKTGWFACSGIFRLYESLTLIAFSLVMMLSINPALTAWTTVPLPILVLIFTKSSSLLHRRYDFLQKRISIVNDTMEACFSGIRVIKAYIREGDQRQRFAEAAEARQRAEISAVRVQAIMESLWGYVWQVGIVVVLLAGGFYVIRGRLTIGEFVAFDSYVLMLIYPMFDIGNFLVRGMRAAASIDRLLELEKHPPMVLPEEAPAVTAVKAASRVPPHLDGRVEFEHVSFGFPGYDNEILHDVSFEAEPGARVALVGRVGSGKSWAARMIPRLVDPTKGCIRVDGVDLKTYDLHAVRQQIGYVPQEPVLFTDTIENNIRFGRETIDAATVDWAVEVSQLNQDLAAFPQGLATRIGVRGMSISGGQKQRLALARALAGKPKILILDDCTSALDARTETALWDRLDEVMPDLTCFIITHRPATLELADQVIVLDNGKIVERGTHAGLLEAQGLYYKLYSRIRLEEDVGLREGSELCETPAMDGEAKPVEDALPAREEDDEKQGPIP